MRKIKVLHLASFDGNIGDNINHYGFYKFLKSSKDFLFEIDKLEIREFYWGKKFFDKSFVKLVNSYDFLIVGGGNYFELWVENSPTGTSIAIELEDLKDIKTPILFNALGVDPAQGVSQQNIKKFKNFIDILIKRDDFISVRNDGALSNIKDILGKEYQKYFFHTVDAGFFIDKIDTTKYYNSKKYIAINVAYDMQDVRFKEIGYQNFLKYFKNFIDKFINEYPDFEIVFIPHIFRDLTFITDLLNILDDDIRRKKISVAPLVHGESSLNEVLGIYNGAKIVLANRFHSNVCALAYKKATVGLVNYQQIEKLYQELDCKNYVDIRKDNFDKELMVKIKALNKNNIYDTTKLEKIYTNYISQVISWLKKKL